MSAILSFLLKIHRCCSILIQPCPERAGMGLSSSTMACGHTVTNGKKPIIDRDREAAYGVGQTTRVKQGDR